jgi:hypothetical protein
MEQVNDEFADTLVADFNKLLNKTDGWTLQVEKKSVFVYTLEDPSGNGNSIMKGLSIFELIRLSHILNFLGVGNIKKSVAEVVGIISDPEARGKWDAFYEEGSVLVPNYKLGNDEVGLARMKFKGSSLTSLDSLCCLTSTLIVELISFRSMDSLAKRILCFLYEKGIRK